MANPSTRIFSIYTQTKNSLQYKWRGKIVKNKETKTNNQSNKTASQKVTAFFTHEIHISALKLGLSILILGIIVIGLWQIKVYYHGKILPKVKIAGVKVGGKTPTEAKKIVADYTNQLNQNGIQITYADQSLKPKLADTGISFDVDKTIDNAYSYGRTGSTFAKLKENVKMIFTRPNTNLEIVTDQAKLDAYLSQVAQTAEIQPVNATLQVDDKGQINLVPEKIGRGIDRDKLKSDLTSLINKHDLNGKISLVVSDLQPAVFSPETANARIQAEQFMAAAPVTSTFEDQSFTASKATVGSWLDFTPSGNQLVTSVSNGKIANYVKTIANKITIKKVDRVVMDGTGEVLEEGQDGRGVSTDQLISDIYKRVSSHKAGASIAIGTYVITKGEITKNPHAEAGRYPGRYIDVNLSEQTLYAFDGFNLVNQFLISSGTYSHPTPTGEYHVYGKSRVTEMKGEGYDLPGVEWVSWWSGDYSIHGTYWHHNFGHPMSHGCVNASNSDAEWIYNWNDIGTPVYVHY